MAEKSKSIIPAKWAIVGIVAIILLVLVATVWGSYNNLVRLNQGVDSSFADVQAQYQRRFDLVPNLVNTVSGAANFEQSTLTALTTLRSQWQADQTAEQKVQTANQFEATLTHLFALTENYPQLTATANFRALQDQLAETENMISVSRTRYNNAVREYNTATMVFPSNVIAGWFGFTGRTYFAASTGAQGAPQVNFTF